MKKQILALALGLVTIGSFAQKKELRAAEKAIKKNNFVGALTAIKSIENSIESADDKYKAKYYFLKGQALAGKRDFSGAGESLSKLLEFERQVGENKYSKKAAPMLNKMIQDVSNTALDQFNNKKDYKEAAKNFFLTYKLSPKDTLFAYNAAIAATKAKEYEKALEYYDELLRVGYTGIKMEYWATDVESGEVKNLGTKKNRDLMVKLKKYVKPEDKASESKKIEIVKSKANLYKNLGRMDEAINAYKEARKAAPDDLKLLLAEAYMYNDFKQPEKFEALMKEAVSKDPTNPDLFFNIGIVNYNEKNGPEAAKYFRKAIELKSDYKNAHIMLANSMLFKDSKLVEEMNALPASDMKNYTRIENERKALFNEILPILLKADELNRDVDTVRLLFGVYQQLENDEEAKKYKALYDSMR